MTFISNSNVEGFYKQRINGFYLTLLLVPVYVLFAVNNFHKYGLDAMLIFIAVGVLVLARAYYFQFKKLKYLNSTINEIEIINGNINFSTLEVSIFWGLFNLASINRVFHLDKTTFEVSENKNVTGYHMYILKEGDESYYLFDYLFDDFERLKSALKENSSFS